MSRPDEGLIHAWLDGECSAEEAARIERLVATDPEWAAAVAEARGLIAASSRIVAALDVVPRAMPAGENTAPHTATIVPAEPEVPVRPAYRVRPWMKMAAGLVLVAGTVYAIREQTRVVFTSPPEVMEHGLLSDPQSPAVAPEIPPVAPLAGPSGEPKPSARTAQTYSAPPPSPVPAPVASGAAVSSVEVRTANADSARIRRFAENLRRLENSPLRNVVTTGTYGPDPERITDAVKAGASPMRLDGCWSITAPDSLRGVLQSPAYVRGPADSIEVELVPLREGRAVVLQGDNTLRGAITAMRVECPKP